MIGMDGAATLLLQTMLVVGLPPLLLYCTPLKRVMPLAVVQKASGIALGPSLLGWLLPGVAATVFPPNAIAAVTTISNLAVTLFAFVIGSHLDRASFAGQGRAFFQISLGSLVTPTAIGIATGWVLAVHYPSLIGAHATYADFAVAIGICVGVTALPMLGAILREMRLLDHRIGQLSLRCAVVNDTVVWVLLGLLLAHCAEERNAHSPWLLVGGSAIYLAVMFFLIRPAFGRMTRVNVTIDQRLVIVSMVAFGSAFATEMLGLHYVLGAFIAGVIVPGTWKQEVVAPPRDCNSNTAAAVLFRYDRSAGFHRLRRPRLRPSAICNLGRNADRQGRWDPHSGPVERRNLV